MSHRDSVQTHGASLALAAGEALTIRICFLVFTSKFIFLDCHLYFFQLVFVKEQGHNPDPNHNLFLRGAQSRGLGEQAFPGITWKNNG